MKLFDATLSRLEHALDARLEQQNVLASNLANADTVGYRARELDFDAAMKAADLPQADAAPSAASAPAVEGHISLSAPGPMHASADQFVKVSQSDNVGLDGNSVDLDKTMVELSKNGLQYGAAAKAAAKKLAILRYVATEGAG